MDTDTTYFWRYAVCFVAFIYLDVKDCSILLKIKKIMPAFALKHFPFYDLTG